MSHQTDIIFSELKGHTGDVGRIILNRPQALNALTTEMCLQLGEKLTEWQQADNIKVVIISGAGDRAFCAGGDIRKVHELHAADLDLAMQFFFNEYGTNKILHHFTKPYIALLDGVSMGGGLGVSVHGSHRVATERALLAMPETGIGFYPDVGASYFLPRLPGKLGYYLGLTGARLDAADSLYAQMVNHVVTSDQLNELVKAVVETDITNNPMQIITDVINRFALTIEKSKLAQQQSVIDHYFAAEKIDDIITALQHADDDWCQQQAQLMLQKSPSSLKVTLKALQLGATLSFDECIQMEYELSRQFLLHRDFYEGVRAVLIDKDQKPQWDPASLAEVTDALVAEYFLG